MYVFHESNGWMTHPSAIAGLAVVVVENVVVVVEDVPVVLDVVVVV